MKSLRAIIAESRDRLKKFRDENARRSFEVIDLWENSLSVFSYKLGSEREYQIHYKIMFIYHPR